MKLRFVCERENLREKVLWRYMRLSAFFLLLKENKVFIPSIRKLQGDDPKESRIRQHSVRPESDAFLKSGEFDEEARKWLDKKYRSRVGASPETTVLESSLTGEWLRQLSMRRFAWCWFASPEKGLSQWAESMAMWNQYARDGVAITTSLDRIEAAVREPLLNEIIVSKMKYCAQGNGLDQRFNDMPYARRPFFFKNITYQHETEIRLVFQATIDPEISGVKIGVDATDLLESGEVVISPNVKPDEADVIIAIAKKFVPGLNLRLSGELTPEPGEPRKWLAHQENLVSLSEPFTQEPDLPRLLREL